MPISCADKFKLFARVYLIFVVLASSALSAFAQVNNVTALDPRVDYTGAWVVQDNGGHELTTTRGSYVTFTFQGSAVFWYSAKDPNGGVANVAVDSANPQTIDASMGTKVNDTPIIEVLFSQTNLDPSKNHTLNISYVGPGALGGPYVTLYLLSFTPPGDTVPTIASAVGSTQTSLAASTPSASSQSTSSDSDIAATLKAAQRTNVILGAVLGSIAGLLLISAILLLTIILRNRNRKPAFGEASPYFVRERPIARSESGFGSKSTSTGPRSPTTPTAEVRSLALVTAENSPRPIQRSPLATTEASGSGSRLLTATFSEAGTSPPVYSA